MSNYVKSTNFTAKDSLPTGDTNKVIRGSEFDTEFNAIQTAIGTKADLAGPTFTGTATFDGITATGTVNFTGGSVTTNIDGGTIDGVTIGGTTAGAGTFSSLTATTADINAGTVDNTVIGGSTPAAGTFSSLTATTADINGGNIDGTVIGASSTAAISGTTGTFSGAVTGSNLNVSNWDTAYGWGDHGVEGYLTSVTFSDIDAGAVTLSTETFANSDTQIPTNAAVRNWVLTTYPTIVEQNNLTLNVTWANVPDANITQSSVTQHQAALSITASQLSDVTSTAAELNILDGVTATTAELNFVDGVTSNIQTQLDSKVGANYTGDVDITGELLVDSYNETFKKLTSTTVTTGYQMGSASLANTVATVSGFSSGTSDKYSTIFFKSDGTRLWLSEHSSAYKIKQYNLSTAWDISTISGSVSETFSTMFGTTDNFVYAFSSDGRYVFGIARGSSPRTIYRCELATAWDITSSKTITSQSNAISGTGYDFAMYLHPDGTKLFVLDSASQVFEFSFGTAYDVTTLVSTATASKNFYASTASTPTGSMEFSSDGTKLYLAQINGTYLLYEFPLSTAWDISSASTTANSSIVVANGSIHAIGIPPEKNGEKLYTFEQSRELREYDFSALAETSTLNCENANVFEAVLEGNTTFTFSNPPASGTPVVSGYQLTSGSYDSKSFSVATQETNPQSVEFSSDGTKMYILGTVQQTVYQYTLSTAFDVSTASYASTSFSVSSQELAPRGVRFKSDGTKMFVVGSSSDAIYQYSLSTAWDVSSASYDSVSFSVASQTTTPEGLAFKSDGTEMYVCGSPSDIVYQYTLSTAWDLSTASSTTSFTASGVDFTELAFNSDGTSVFILDKTSDAIIEYSLSTAWNISTATASGDTLSVSSQEDNPKGIAFNATGTKVYIVGETNDTVYQYSTSVSNLNDSTAYAMSLKVVQDSGASGYTVTWPTSVDWPSATAPTLTATASAVDQFVFYTYDGGTTWYGFTAGQALG